MIIKHLPNRLVYIDGLTYRYFSGTSYLGIPHQADFRAALVEAFGQYGTSYGSSRNNLLQLEVFEQAEAYIARYVGAQAALICSSGLLAGQILVKFLEEKYPASPFFYAPKSHPANWGKHFQPNDTSWEKWCENLSEKLAGTSAFSVIFCNSVDSFSCEPTSFKLLFDSIGQHPCVLVLDDSHGLGVLGKGRGIWGQLKPPPTVEILVTASMNKGWGLPGGVILGNKARVEALQQSSFWIGASPMVPAYLAAFLQVPEVYEQAFDTLQKNILFLEKNLPHDGLFQHLLGYPVFKSTIDGLFEHLTQHDIMPYHFTYPSQGIGAVTRLVVSALHQIDDLSHLVEVCTLLRPR